MFRSSASCTGEGFAGQRRARPSSAGGCGGGHRRPYSASPSRLCVPQAVGLSCSTRAPPELGHTCFQGLLIMTQCTRPPCPAPGKEGKSSHSREQPSARTLCHPHLQGPLRCPRRPGHCGTLTGRESKHPPPKARHGSGGNSPGQGPPQAAQGTEPTMCREPEGDNMLRKNVTRPQEPG